MLRSALKPTAARFEDPSSEEDIRSDSSTGLSSNQWAPFRPRWTTDRSAAAPPLKSSFRGRTKSPAPSRRVRFVRIIPAERPRSATRSSFSDEGTWGTLFDSRGRETDRMEHILKKLGGYIRANWAPYDTHVITPEKMLKFYSCYQIENERLPFRDLFSPKTSNKRIAAVYDHLGVDYVQHDGRHSTPGLTRLGFAQFLSKTIRAFPDEEHRRLQIVIQAIPFDIDDNTQGGGYVRVPRSLPRHFLPEGPGAETYRGLLHDAFRRAISGSSSGTGYSSSSEGSGSGSGSGSGRREKRGENKSSTSHHRHGGHSRHHTTTTTTTATLVGFPSPKQQPGQQKKKKVTIITPSSSPPPPLIRNPPPLVSSSSSTTRGDSFPATRDSHAHHHHRHQHHHQHHQKQQQHDSAVSFQQHQQGGYSPADRTYHYPSPSPNSSPRTTKTATTTTAAAASTTTLPPTGSYYGEDGYYYYYNDNDDAERYRTRKPEGRGTRGVRFAARPV